ncbi:MAG: S49 family peptidase, partial [Spirochaetaceae bacterium]|nr:S49 family peptidase [Spirochaetaceae bacterium]
FDKHGIKMTTFKAGKNKNMLNYNSPVTEEHAAIMQSIVDEAYDQFTGIVAESRKIPLYEVRQIADGRVYTANQALYNHLIDDICSYDSALDDMKSTCFPDLKSSDIDVNVIEKQRKKTFLDILKDAEMSFKASPNPVEAVIAERFDAMPSGLLYYCQF